MKKESAAIERLTKIQSEVSSHYLVRNNGEILTLVPDLYIAWHAGISSWKNDNSLNKNSIGIEISNPGHQFNYKRFSEKQIKSLLNLSKLLIKKYKISSQNILGHSDIAPDRKKDPGEKFPWNYLAKKKVGQWHNVKSEILKHNRNHKVKKADQINFIKNLFKIGYSKKKPKYLIKEKYRSFMTAAFQRRYRPELVNSKIDKECLIISQNLAKKRY